MKKKIQQQQDTIDLLELKLQQSTKNGSTDRSSYYPSKNSNLTPSSQFINTSYQGTNDLSFP